MCFQHVIEPKLKAHQTIKRQHNDLHEIIIWMPGEKRANSVARQLPSTQSSAALAGSPLSTGLTKLIDKKQVGK